MALKNKPEPSALPPVSGTQTTKKPDDKPKTTGLEGYSLDALYELRQRIDKMLPSLRDIDMERELVAQLHVVKKLQQDTLDSKDVPANQQAQVAGQVANILGTLGKLQVEIYDSERLKKIEEILINCLEELPSEQQAKFLASYEAKLA